jgi:hypothetical protein
VAVGADRKADGALCKFSAWSISKLVRCVRCYQCGITVFEFARHFQTPSPALESLSLSHTQLLMTTTSRAVTTSSNTALAFKLYQFLCAIQPHINYKICASKWKRPHYLAIKNLQGRISGKIYRPDRWKNITYAHIIEYWTILFQTYSFIAGLQRKYAAREAPCRT